MKKTRMKRLSVSKATQWMIISIDLQKWNVSLMTAWGLVLTIIFLLKNIPSNYIHWELGLRGTLIRGIGISAESISVHLIIVITKISSLPLFGRLKLVKTISQLLYPVKKLERVFGLYVQCRELDFFTYFFLLLFLYIFLFLYFFMFHVLYFYILRFSFSYFVYYILFCTFYSFLHFISFFLFVFFILFFYNLFFILLFISYLFYSNLVETKMIFWTWMIFMLTLLSMQEERKEDKFRFLECKLIALKRTHLFWLTERVYISYIW